MEGVFDPLDIVPYFGKVFVTQNSKYMITLEGKISGSKNLDGAKIMMIAGINPKDRDELLGAFHHSKEAYDKVLKEKATELDIGKSLAISLTPEDTNKKFSSGLITSSIERIE